MPFKSRKSLFKVKQEKVNSEKLKLTFFFSKTNDIKTSCNRMTMIYFCFELQRNENKKSGHKNLTVFLSQSHQQQWWPKVSLNKTAKIMSQSRWESLLLLFFIPCITCFSHIFIHSLSRSFSSILFRRSMRWLEVIDHLQWFFPWIQCLVSEQQDWQLSSNSIEDLINRIFGYFSRTRPYITDSKTCSSSCLLIWFLADDTSYKFNYLLSLFWCR